MDDKFFDILFNKARTVIPDAAAITDLSLYSFEEFQKRAGAVLNHKESEILYKEAQRQALEKDARSLKSLKRTNPQLKNMIISFGAEHEENLLPENFSVQALMDGGEDAEDRLFHNEVRYASAGQAASVFSPAAYLAKLYSEARTLHDPEDIRFLDKRRPDLGNLLLSQENLDHAVSSLSLSNDILMQAIKTQDLASKDRILDFLAKNRMSGGTPYNHAFETLRHCVSQSEDRLANILTACAQIDGATDDKGLCLGLLTGFDPELCAVLKEKITNENAAKVFRENFPDWTLSEKSPVDGHAASQFIASENRGCGWLLDINNLADYYDMPAATVKQAISAIQTMVRGVDLYVDGTYTHVLQTAGALSAVQLTRTTDSGYVSMLYYAGLIPSAKTYCLRIKPRASMVSSMGNLSVLQAHDTSYKPIYSAKHYGADTEREIVIDGVDLANGQQFMIRRFDDIGYSINSQVTFTVSDQADTSFFLLKLNKCLRLSKATGLDPADVARVILSDNLLMDIDEEVIRKFFKVVYYRDRYNITGEEALALCQAAISDLGISGDASQFDRLFNPSGSQQHQLVPGDDVVINLDLDNKEQQEWKNALKRVLKVNDAELLAMAGRKICHLSLGNIGRMYFIHLLSRVHSLTVLQTIALLKILGFDPAVDDSWKQEKQKNFFKSIVMVADQTMQWLKAQSLTVEHLVLMTAKDFFSQQTSQMTTLAQMLKSSLAAGKWQDSDKLLPLMTPSFATALNINDHNSARNMLLWLDMLQSASQMRCKDFADEIMKSGREISLSAKAIEFCQRAGQLALVMRALNLHEMEMNLVTRYPQKITGDDSGVLPLGVPSFKRLTDVRQCLARCGGSATQVVDALTGGKLSLAMLASVSGDNENAVVAASGLKDKDSTVNDFAVMGQIFTMLDLSKALNVSPQVTNSLMQLKSASDYARIQHVADSLSAGLEEQARQHVCDSLDEKLSAALSAHFLYGVLPAKGVWWVSSRDDLYQFLLIDNQVSSSVKTTRIAQAIASIQFYINNCLHDLEKNVSPAGRSRSFFLDWNRCNKRYSQWAASKKLLHYPENYLNPTQRAGQTAMMDRLLQSISQSQLDSDNVEDAIRSYLTDFETIANLSVISAYHDGINADKGRTYLVGRSETEPAEYYWRSIDQSQREQGRFPASAWSEWQKIDTAVQPAGKLIHAVISNYRLNIVWIERRQKKKQNSDNTYNTVYEHVLKLAHMRHDKTWSTPFSFPIIFDKALEAYNTSQSLDDLALYAALWAKQNKLIVILYKKADSYGNEQFADFCGQCLLIDQNLNSEQLTGNAFESLYQSVFNQLSTTGCIKVNNQCGEAYNVPQSMMESSAHADSSYRLRRVYGSYLTDISITPATLRLSMRPQIKLVKNLMTPFQSLQCDVIKKYGAVGDKFLLYRSVNKNKDHAKADATLVPVVQFKGNASGNKEERFLFYTDVDNPKNMRVWLNQKRDITLSSATGRYGCIKDDKNQPEDYQNYSFMIFHDANSNTYAFNISNPVEIDTAVEASNVKISINMGRGHTILRFAADKYCSSLPAPDFDEMIYNFDPIEFDVPANLFINNEAVVKITAEAWARNGLLVGNETFMLPVTRKVVGAAQVMSLHTTSQGAQYLQAGCYRTRLNTLFAKKLVAKANDGLDAIFTLETQNLSEPQLGAGTYATLVMKKYDQAVHGDEKDFKLVYCDVFEKGDRLPIYHGTLSEYNAKPVKVFLPRMDEGYGNKDNLYIRAVYARGETSDILLKRDNKFDPHGWALDQSYNNGTFPGLESVNGLKDNSEPMDFCGANALYFWELFYYVPMLVASRLLQENRFDEAEHWVKYIFDPSGYVVNGHYQARHWNVRPLIENSGWSRVATDLNDPDAIAQHDPYHYRLATFMCLLDLLMARGDAAYRMLEQDTLVEAMMWYGLASDLQPVVNSSSGAAWKAPTLAMAAGARPENLFLPETNTRLAHYSATLRQRISNLRHNLSIDGQPLFLPYYAKPADPRQLIRAATPYDQGGHAPLPEAYLPPYRFPLMLERARSLVGQLMQFGNQLLTILERQDAEELARMMQDQARALIMMSIEMQKQAIEELKFEEQALQQQKNSAQLRLDHYQKLHDDNISRQEQDVLETHGSAHSTILASIAPCLAGAWMDTAPNIFGLADGGMHLGALLHAGSAIMNIEASATLMSAEKTNLSENYRRRREDWDIQRKTAKAELEQIEAQLKAQAIRYQAAGMQKTYLETQEAQSGEQLDFLKRKFTSQTLYSYLRGRLGTVYSQFYDIALSRCMMCEAAYNREVNGDARQAPRFVRPGAWNIRSGGLLSGESLMQSLAQMEEAYLRWDSRALEVNRTVSLAQAYAGLPGRSFALAEALQRLIKAGQGSAGDMKNGVTLQSNGILQASVALNDLGLADDYPPAMQLGEIRCIKQISVTLPALVGPYQDIQATLHYSGGAGSLPEGCQAIAVSGGMNDSGQFQLDFNDGKYLPFEGIPLHDTGTFVLRFPHVNAKQKHILLSLSDIILHIRYTIRKK